MQPKSLICCRVCQNLLSFCLKARLSNILSSVASASGSLVLQRQEKHKTCKQEIQNLIQNESWWKKKESTNRFPTGSRVSQQRVGSFCGNLFQNLAEVFGNISAQKSSKIDKFRNRQLSMGLDIRLPSYLQHTNERHKVDSLQPIFIQVWGKRATSGHHFNFGDTIGFFCSFVWISQ